MLHQFSRHLVNKRFPHADKSYVPAGIHTCYPQTGLAKCLKFPGGRLVPHAECTKGTDRFQQDNEMNNPVQ